MKKNNKCGVSVGLSDLEIVKLFLSLLQRLLRSCYVPDPYSIYSGGNTIPEVRYFLKGQWEVPGSLLRRWVVLKDCDGEKPEPHPHGWRRYTGSCFIRLELRWAPGKSPASHPCELCSEERRALYLSHCSCGVSRGVAFTFVVWFFAVPAKDKLQKNTCVLGRELLAACGHSTFFLFQAHYIHFSVSFGTFFCAKLFFAKRNSYILTELFTIVPSTVSEMNESHFLPSRCFYSNRRDSNANKYL